mmetsp:Transcript_12285/g.15962  ORF Transcript_12285/g.15962 Transcript_12285/m.15962 type:complete len:205 (-) Transcript_12285:1029-1643(-)
MGLTLGAPVRSLLFCSVTSGTSLKLLLLFIPVRVNMRGRDFHTRLGKFDFRLVFLFLGCLDLSNKIRAAKREACSPASLVFMLFQFTSLPVLSDSETNAPTVESKFSSKSCPRSERTVALFPALPWPTNIILERLQEVLWLLSSVSKKVCCLFFLFSRSCLSNCCLSNPISALIVISTRLVFVNKASIRRLCPALPMLLLKIPK